MSVKYKGIIKIGRHKVAQVDGVSLDFVAGSTMQYASQYVGEIETSMTIKIEKVKQ